MTQDAEQSLKEINATVESIRRATNFILKARARIKTLKKQEYSQRLSIDEKAEMRGLYDGINIVLESLQDPALLDSLSSANDVL